MMRRRGGGTTKERVTLTIDNDLLIKVDSTIDNTTIKNRSHAVEVLLRRALKNKMPSTAIILGGRGERLKPSAENTPKTLLPINDLPIVHYNIDLLRRFGVTNIILSIGGMGEQIKRQYGDGSAHGVRISYLEEKEPLGTAGCLRLLKGQLSETFFMMNADELKDIDLIRMFEAHVKNQGTATIALWTVEDPSSYGVAMLDGNRILRFVEKPKKEDAPSKLINAGLYLMEPEVISYVPEGFAMLEQDVFPKLAREGKLYGYPFSGQWFDTGTTERFEHAGKEWRGFTKTPANQQ